jgi:iron complex transport system permease protein
VLAVSLASLVALAAAIALGLAVGVEPVHLGRALSDPGSIDATIVFGARLGRVLLGAVIGAALAPAGVAFQALLRNPLADPYVLGVSGGASVAATAALVLSGPLASGLLGALTLPGCAFLGALGSIALVLRLGRVRGRLVPNVALLAGVILNSLASALIVTLRIIASPQAAHQALYWLTGSLAPVPPLRLAALAAYVLGSLGHLYLRSAPLNALALGDEAAHTVGVDIARARRSVFVAASLLTGAAVAVAGPIGFVGIVVPHLLRLSLGPDHRLLLPAAALLGAAFVVLCDLGARLAFLWLSTEPTVGVVTALCGAPFFLVLLRRRGAERPF